MGAAAPAVCVLTTRHISGQAELARSVCVSHRRRSHACISHRCWLMPGFLFLLPGGGLGGSDEAIRTYQARRRRLACCIYRGREQQRKCQRITADELAHSSGHLVRRAGRCCSGIRWLLAPEPPSTAALETTAQSANPPWHRDGIRVCRPLRVRLWFCSCHQDQPCLLVQKYKQAVSEIREPRGIQDPAASGPVSRHARLKSRCHATVMRGESIRRQSRSCQRKIGCEAIAAPLSALWAAGDAGNPPSANVHDAEPWAHDPVFDWPAFDH